MTDGQKKLIEKYAVMFNPDEVVFTHAGLAAFIKAVSKHTLFELNEEVLSHAKRSTEEALG